MLLKTFNGQLWSNGTSSINHNMYAHNINGNDYIFHSCYTTGLRIYKVERNDSLDEINLSEVGYFDTFYQLDGDGWNGQWSNYYWMV